MSGIRQRGERFEKWLIICLAAESKRHELKSSDASFLDRMTHTGSFLILCKTVKTGVRNC